MVLNYSKIPSKDTKPKFIKSNLGVRKISVAKFSNSTPIEISKVISTKLPLSKPADSQYIQPARLTSNQFAPEISESSDKLVPTSSARQLFNNPEPLSFKTHPKAPTPTKNTLGDLQNDQSTTQKASKSSLSRPSTLQTPRKSSSPMPADLSNYSESTSSYRKASYDQPAPTRSKPSLLALPANFTQPITPRSSQIPHSPLTPKKAASPRSPSNLGKSMTNSFANMQPRENVSSPLSKSPLKAGEQVNGSMGQERSPFDMTPQKSKASSNVNSKADKPRVASMATPSESMKQAGGMPSVEGSREESLATGGQQQNIEQQGEPSVTETEEAYGGEQRGMRQTQLDGEGMGLPGQVPSRQKLQQISKLSLGSSGNTGKTNGSQKSGRRTDGGSSGYTPAMEEVREEGSWEDKELSSVVAVGPVYLPSSTDVTPVPPYAHRDRFDSVDNFVRYSGESNYRSQSNLDELGYLAALGSTKEASQDGKFFKGSPTYKSGTSWVAENSAPLAREFPDRFPQNIEELSKDAKQSNSSTRRLMNANLPKPGIIVTRETRT
jgi:hypothetical protein